MTGRCRGRTRGRVEGPGTDEYYECTNCQATVEEWTEDCPVCDQLVVRVVPR